MMSSYNMIGLDYAQLRKADPRIAAMIDRALGAAKTVLNVGAGAGSYEPASRSVLGLEPSIEMIRQRAASAGPAVLGRAEALPFADKAFDAVMATMTVHHWADQPLGLQELRRVARDLVVVMTFDPSFRQHWLHNYFPGLVDLDDAQMPSMSLYGDYLGPHQTYVLPVPHDCTDGFLYAYWRRPTAYLDQRVRAAMSSFWALGDISGELATLQADLESGAWEARYGDLLERDALDCGYRLVVAGQ